MAFAILKTFKSFINPPTCKKRMAEIVVEDAQSPLLEMPAQKPNQLQQLLTMFPDKPWDWSSLSHNPNITMEWIATHPESNDLCAWEWARVCENPNLTMHFFLNTLLPKLEQEQVEERDTVKIDTAQLLKKKLSSKEFEDHCWEELSVNPGLKYQEICTHYASCTIEERRRYKWRWSTMASRSDVSLEMLMMMSIATTAGPNANVDTNDNDGDDDNDRSRQSFGVWNASAASNNPNLTTAVVLKYPSLWNWQVIAANSAVVPTKELISHPRYNRFSEDSVCSLSRHPLLSFQLVLDDCRYCCDLVDHDELWDWTELPENPVITIEMMLTHLELPWDWEQVSTNPNLTVQHLRSPQLLPYGNQWDKEFVSSNSGIPANFIINSRTATDEKQRFLVCDFLSDNCNLTAEQVAKNMDLPWDWETMSLNNFAFEKTGLAKKELTYHEKVDPQVWNALLFTDDHYVTVGRGNRRLPTPLAKLTLEYFSPLY